MWLYLTFLLIIGSAVADHHHAWETGNEYHFHMRSRTLTVLDNLAGQFSGILIRGDLTVQVKSSDTLQAVVSQTQYAPVHKVLPEGWDSEITDLEFIELSLSGKPFEIKTKHGVIRDVLIDRDVPTWEVNLLKSIVSQLQIDTQGENVITSRGTQVPVDSQPFGTFKAMEDSVGGKCEVLYNIMPLPEDVLFNKPELVPLPNLRKDGHYIDITKTKNYTRCEQRMAYHSGIVGKMNWKLGSNDGLLSRSSTSRILISGNLKRFTIQSSVTTNKIFISSKIHDTYSGAVYSRVNLTLNRMNEISNLMPASNSLVSTGNLVYIYNNPFSSERNPRRPSVSRSSLPEESRSNDDSNSSSSSSSSNSEERDYLQPKPKLDDAPESPLLPYFIGYKGKSIQKSKENYARVAAQLIDWIASKLRFLSVDLLQEPFTDILEQHIILVKLIRTMDVNQMTEIEDKLPLMFDLNKFPNKEIQKEYNQTAWDVFCNAVVHAGTGPALITIKNWIKNKKLEGAQAAHIISQIPKTALIPTAEYVRVFFELITDEQVRKERVLNTTAPLSFAELVRYTQSNKSSTYYPVYSFGRMVSKHDNAFLETYIPYMATQLTEAIKEGDSSRIQTYIMALSNFGHPKILSIFEPYLEGTLPVSKFQRLMMVVSLNRLSENFPRIARSVAYKIYVNVMESYELRCAAVYVIMKTNPPLSMLQRMAEFTNQDQNKHVNSAVKTSIDSLANLKQPELRDLASKARIARKILNPHIYTENYSQSILEEVSVASLNIAQISILQTIGSDDFVMPKSAHLNIHQSYGGLNLPSSKITYTISSIRKLLDMWYQMPWFTENKTEKKLIIEQIIEKLDIKPEDQEQIEGNIFTDTFFSSVFCPFDNHTFEEIGNMLTTYFNTFKPPTQDFRSTIMNYLNYYDMTLGFPTESGLPFIYTLTIPTLISISSGGSHTVQSSSTERFTKVTVAGQILSSEKIQSRIGFVTPFEHRQYLAGIDINTQIFIPTGLSVKFEGKQKFELKIQPPESFRYGTGHMAIHHSVVPYTARHDILSFDSVANNDTRLVNTKEPHVIEFMLGDGVFAAKSDLIDSETSKKMGIETFSEVFNVFSNSGAHYRRFDAILYISEAEVNITVDKFMMYDVNNSVATIPAIIDKQPESMARKEQFLKEVSKDVKSATSYVYDISVFTKGTRQVLTLALANSIVDNKFQALVYWNIQSPNDGRVFLEFCTIGYTQSSQSIPLNLNKVIEEIPKDEFKAEMRFENCANGETIKLKGNWTRTDDLKEKALKSEIVEKCRQEMKQGNIWLPTCQRASKLIRQKDHLMMSVDMDSDRFYTAANGIILNIMMLVSKENMAKPNSKNVNKNTIDMEIKMPSDNNDAEISLRTSETDITFSLTDVLKEKFEISQEKYLEGNSEGLACVLDKTQVATFDSKVYPLKLGNCWHVMMTTYPKDSGKTWSIPKYLRMIVMAREMDDGSKQIRMVLGEQEIRLQKSSNYLEATVNDQVVLLAGSNLSHYESYREDTFEIYRLGGMIAISSLEYENYAVYDGERILLRPSYGYLNAVRGICGNYDMQSDNDFIIPKNCILTKPEEFAATYALTEENCQGPALQNKQKAEQSTCIPRSYRPSDVISDREAGRSSTWNRGWGYH